MKSFRFTFSLLVAFFIATGLSAQNLDQDRDMQQFRSPSQTGIHQFEALETDEPWEGFNVRLGGGFAVQYQALSHSTGTTADTLIDIRNNFNLPTANLDLDVALADGVRMHLRTYLSSRHHPDSWVKGGYVQIGNLNFLREGLLENLMDFTTVKVGMMEINYGDYHFRRTDNARAIYNPFVGNLIMDAFNTEAGAELYFTPGDFLVMVGATNGDLNQSVDDPGVEPTPAILGKIGYDKQINEDLRVRLTGSYYGSAEGQTNFLYFGDRAGSRYYLTMADQDANATDDFRTGRVNPSMINEVNAIMINPFVKFQGLEFFGTFETVSGKISGEAQTRTWTQLHAELLYRFGSREQFYAGGKFNSVEGGQPNFNPTVDPNQVDVSRYAFGAGWYMTPNVLLKAEYVNQDYNGYGNSSLLHEGNFNGAMLEATIGF